jgi:predicted transcriptional regulator of viral defense system
MRNANQDLRAFLQNHPVFSGEEFAAFLNARGSSNPRTRESILRYHKRWGTILQVRRGLYCAVPPGTNPEQMPVDSYLVASRLAADAVLAYHTALELHGRSYSVQDQLVYLTSKYPSGRSFEFRGISYRAVAPPTRLNSKETEIETADRAGQLVRVTSLERTFVDVLDRTRLSGGWEEVWRSLETIPYLYLDRVAEYTLLLGNSTTVARVGFYLSQHREALSVEDSLLARLRERRPRNPKYLTNDEPRSGRLVAEWNLVVPEQILRKSWEELA